MTKKAPCGNCPWRKDAPREHWDPQHFEDIWRNCQDDGHSLMLCHKSKPAQDKQIPCAGAILVVGFASIGLRIAAMQGRVDPDDYSSDKIPLFKSFEDMLEANRVKLPKRNNFLNKIR